MRLHGTLPLLEAMGVPASVLDREHVVVQDEKGWFHLRAASCWATQKFDFPETSLSLRGLTSSSACSCTIRKFGPSGNPWHLAASLVKWYAEVNFPVLPEDPVALSERFRSLETTIGTLQEDQAVRLRNNRVTFPAATSYVLEKLEQAQAETLEVLRSPAVQSLLVRSPGQRLIAGLIFRGGRPSRSEAIDALLLSFGPEKENALLLDIPTEGMVKVYPWIDSVRSTLKDVNEYVFEVGETDTPEVIETARALWDPHGYGELASLKKAFEAARRLCAVTA